MVFHPDGVRRHVTNWPDVAEALVRRARREAIGGVTDERAQKILAEVLVLACREPTHRNWRTQTPGDKTLDRTANPVTGSIPRGLLSTMRTPTVS
jgi:hypothetical protein